MKQSIRGLAAGVALAFAMASTGALAADKTALTTPKDKVSYAFGMQLANSFTPIASQIDVAAFEAEINNILAGKSATLTMEQAQATDTALRNSLQAVQGAAPGTLPPAVDKVKVAQMLGGHFVGPSLKQFKSDIDLPVVIQAVRTAFAKGTPLMDVAQAQATLQEFTTRQAAQLGEKNRAEGAAFWQKNKAEKGVITTGSGLQYMVLRAGSGPRPTSGSTVSVNYVGKLLDGTEFDSSYKRGQPAEFPLGSVIAGWTEGLQLMGTGAKYRFWIPSDLGYGPNGQPQGGIGPNALLTFDVELLGVK